MLHSLYTMNRHGERAADDVVVLVRLLDQWCQQNGVCLALTNEALGHQILKYISLRRGLAAHQISGPQMNIHWPDEWDDEAENIWTQWIGYTFEVDRWHDILGGVFGSDVRSWEPEGSAGWRDDLFAFLPFWIQRDTTVLDEIDPTPLPELVDTTYDPRAAKIDPYLLEHGGRRGRRLRGGAAAGVAADEA